MWSTNTVVKDQGKSQRPNHRKCWPHLHWLAPAVREINWHPRSHVHSLGWTGCSGNFTNDWKRSTVSNNSWFYFNGYYAGCFFTPWRRMSSGMSACMKLCKSSNKRAFKTMGTYGMPASSRGSQDFHAPKHIKIYQHFFNFIVFAFDNLPSSMTLMGSELSNEIFEIFSAGGLRRFWAGFRKGFGEKVAGSFWVFRKGLERVPPNSKRRKQCVFQCFKFLWGSRSRRWWTWWVPLRSTRKAPPWRWVPWLRGRTVKRKR